MKKGIPKSQFIISDILPLNDKSQNDHKGCITIEGIGSESFVEFRTLFPSDALEFTATLSGAQTIYPFGNHSVWRFQNKVDFGTPKSKALTTFNGDVNDPLAFMLVNKKGFVYLHGKGTVKLPDGRQYELPGAKGTVYYK